MDFLKELIKFFTDRTYSTTSKFFGIIFGLLVLLLIDNLLGFSFYYSKNQKIIQLINIENLKKTCSENEKIINLLNDTENDILDRKNIFESFVELFSRDKLDIKKTKPLIKIDTVFIENIDTIFIKDTSNIQLKSGFNNQKEKKSVNSRSRIWHTLTSSYVLIILLILFPIIPFTEEKFSWGTMVGMILLMVLDAGLIWLNQFLFGLIPLILNKAWINYILNVVIQTGFWTWIGLALNKKKK